MGRDAMKAGENPCFRCRKEAAKYNDRLNSREGAAELLGVSVSSLADYELGITKVIPVDKVVLMAELYGSPELKAWYCAEECPIGRGFPMPSAELSSVERTAMQLLKQLRESDVHKAEKRRAAGQYLFRVYLCKLWRNAPLRRICTPLCGAFWGISEKRAGITALGKCRNRKNISSRLYR